MRPAEIDGLLAAELNGRKIEHRGELRGALGRALDFPDYYGANWDAFEECLYDRDIYRGQFGSTTPRPSGSRLPQDACGNQ